MGRIKCLSGSKERGRTGQLLAPVAKLILEFLHICLIQFRDNQIVEAPLIPTTETVPLLGLNIEIDRMTCHGPYEYIDKAALALVDDCRHRAIL